MQVVKILLTKLKRQQTNEIKKAPFSASCSPSTSHSCLAHHSTNSYVDETFSKNAAFQASGHGNFCIQQVIEQYTT
jgi:hypothetical protein